MPNYAKCITLKLWTLHDFVLCIILYFSWLCTQFLHFMFALCKSGRTVRYVVKVGWSCRLKRVEEGLRRFQPPQDWTLNLILDDNFVSKKRGTIITVKARAQRQIGSWAWTCLSPLTHGQGILATILPHWHLHKIHQRLCIWNKQNISNNLLQCIAVMCRKGRVALKKALKIKCSQIVGQWSFLRDKCSFLGDNWSLFYV